MGALIAAWVFLLATIAAVAVLGPAGLWLALYGVVVAAGTTAWFVDRRDGRMAA